MLSDLMGAPIPDPEAIQPKRVTVALCSLSPQQREASSSKVPRCEGSCWGSSTQQACSRGPVLIIRQNRSLSLPSLSSSPVERENYYPGTQNNAKGNADCETVISESNRLMWSL